MLLNFLILSNFINNSFDYYLIKSKKFDFVNNSQILFSSQKISVENIGIVDFRFILKKSNAMKILGDKFILLENEMNKKMKIKQNYLKNKESFIKKQKSNLSVLKYNEKLDLFKKEVLATQKKFKQERVILNNSFNKIQNELKNMLAKVIKDLSIKKNINVVILKENIFLYNKLSLDISDEVLQIFNEKTKSLKIIISSKN